MSSLPLIASIVRGCRRSLAFRTRTSVYVTAVVLLPLILFVIFVRAYLGDRLKSEYNDRAQTALNTAERVIEDYLASTNSARPEQVLDDDVLSWLPLVIGHELHLYRDEQPIPSSRADLFAAPAPDRGLLVTTFRDMAQSIRRQQNDLRHERDRLQTLLENINAAVVVLDGRMRVVATNLAARKLFGEGIVFHPEVRDFLENHRQRRAVSAELELSVDYAARTFRVL